MRFASLCVVIACSGSAGAIEKPSFKLLEKDGAFQIRAYQAIPVASAPMSGMENRNGSFRKLFRYIQGQNAQQKKIAMTSPVFMETGSTGERKDTAGRMSFMIPAEVAADGAPAPSGGEVSIGTLEAGTVAVLRFKGHRSAEKRGEAATALETWVKNKGLKAAGAPFFAGSTLTTFTRL